MRRSPFGRGVCIYLFMYVCKYVSMYLFNYVNMYLCIDVEKPRENRGWVKIPPETEKEQKGVYIKYI